MSSPPRPSDPDPDGDEDRLEASDERDDDDERECDRERLRCAVSSCPRPGPVRDDRLNGDAPRLRPGAAVGTGASLMGFVAIANAPRFSLGTGNECQLTSPRARGPEVGPHCSHVEHKHDALPVSK